LNSPGGSTLECGRWLWDDMHGIHPNVCHNIGFLHLVWILTISPQSTCHPAQIGPHSADKNDVMLIFKMADLSHLGF